jgi:hypothetical protein
MPSQESLVNDVEQFLVFQKMIGLTHPRFPQIADSLCEESPGKYGRRGAAESNHLFLPPLSPLAGSARSNC